jgi:hypothetical protein
MPRPAAGGPRPAAGMPHPAAGMAHTNPGSNGVHPPPLSAPGGHAAMTYRDVTRQQMPANREEGHTPGGSLVRTRADGSRAEIHDAHRGMDIHYGLNGSRHVMTERSDHSRIFAERGGRGYVQHPYEYRGQEFAHRTYFDHGHEFVRFYARFAYHGVALEVYEPVTYYPAAYYGWVDTPWGESIRYTWGWRGTPWYRVYGAYFTPYPVYGSAPLWLTDYVIATSLQAAYAAQVRAQMAADNSAVGLSPEVKDEIAQEVQGQVQQEMAAARANTGNSQGAPDDGGVSTLLSDGHAHVFMPGSVLDLVDAGGNECTLSPGDVVQVRAAPAPGAQAVNATVLASKGGYECATDRSVRMPLADLQESENYMRQTLEQGMADLQAKQGTGNLPPAPAAAQGALVNASFATGAPPADPNAEAEITQEANAADQVERESLSADAQQ